MRRAIVLLLCASSCGGGGGGKDDALVHTEVDGQPAVELEDGTVVLLQTIEETQAYIDQFPAPDEEAPEEYERLVLPRRVDLRRGGPWRNAGTIKSQGSRNTCVAFATAAVLEAAYLRERDLDLDLSEQYANHIMKMTALPREHQTIFQREIQLGARGGSGLAYQLANLYRLRFGIPLEETMLGIVEGDDDVSYISWGDYEDTDQDGDDPLFYGTGQSQIEVDAWNLSYVPTEYLIPAGVTLTNLPRSALEGAVYGASRVRTVGLGVDSIRSELAAGREVAFTTIITRPREGRDEEEFEDGKWMPLTEERGAHAMLIVGYDDDRDAFIVKNSWGRNRDGRGEPSGADVDADGYIEMSYDYVRLFREAYSVLETRNPAGFINQQPLLGLWNAELDSFVGRASLAAYHIPGAFPNTSLSGETDRRIGTIYSDDAGAFRVNGSFSGARELRAYFGTNAINDSYDVATGGQEIRAYVYRDDPTWMAGTMTDHTSGDEVTPFFATTGARPEMRAAREDATDLELEDFTGRWTLNDSGTVHRLQLVRVEGGQVEGYYVDPDTSAWIDVVELRPDPDDPCQVELEVGFPAGTRTYPGRVYCGDNAGVRHAAMAGTRAFASGPRGWHATRNGISEMKILTPAYNASFPRGQPVTFFGVVSGELEDGILWFSTIDGQIGSGQSFTRNDLSFGTHMIRAVADFAGGSSVADIRIRITNDPPVIDIYDPAPGAGPFCTGEQVTFRATVSDINNPPTYTLPGTAVDWSDDTGAVYGTGKVRNHTFAQPGTVVVTAHVVDDGNLEDEDTVSVTIEDCPDSPPTVAITSPAADSGTSDSAYVYDGFEAGTGRWYTDVTVAGTGSDAEDGALTGASLVWTTNRTDIQTAALGTGTGPTIRLYSDDCFGVWHDVTLTATDSDGNSRSTVRRIFIWTLC